MEVYHSWSEYYLQTIFNQLPQDQAGIPVCINAALLLYLVLARNCVQIGWWHVTFVS